MLTFSPSTVMRWYSSHRRRPQQQMGTHVSGMAQPYSLHPAAHTYNTNKININNQTKSNVLWQELWWWKPSSWALSFSEAAQICNMWKNDRISHLQGQVKCMESKFRMQEMLPESAQKPGRSWWWYTLLQVAQTHGNQSQRMEVWSSGCSFQSPLLPAPDDKVHYTVTIYATL